MHSKHFKTLINPDNYATHNLFTITCAYFFRSTVSVLLLSGTRGNKRFNWFSPPSHP